jgi:hypothetical protein
MREIFHVGPQSRIYAVPVKLNPIGPAVDVGTPVPLFALRPGSSFDVTRDGQRFLINAPIGETLSRPITVVLNWKPPGR